MDLVLLLCVCYVQYRPGGEFQQSLPVKGNESLHCVMVKGSELVWTHCSEEHRFACGFSYPGE